MTRSASNAQRTRDHARALALAANSRNAPPESAPARRSYSRRSLPLQEEEVVTPSGVNTKPTHARRILTPKGVGIAGGVSSNHT
eukprot:6916421-Ditylum_brightwellii.AAC.1